MCWRTSEHMRYASVYLCQRIFGNGCWQETAAIFFSFCCRVFLSSPSPISSHLHIAFIEFRIYFLKDFSFLLLLDFGFYNSCIWIKMHTKYRWTKWRAQSLSVGCVKSVCALFIVYYFYLLPFFVCSLLDRKWTGGAHTRIFFVWILSLSFSPSLSSFFLPW